MCVCVCVWIRFVHLKIEHDEMLMGRYSTENFQENIKQVNRRR